MVGLDLYNSVKNLRKRANEAPSNYERYKLEDELNAAQLAFDSWLAQNLERLLLNDSYLLTEEEYNAIIEACENPAPATQALKDLIKRGKDVLGH